MATLSATAALAAASAPAKKQVGTNTVSATYETSASISVGDVIHMMKIPVGATVTDMKISVNGPPAGTQLKVSVGDNGDRDRYFDSASMAPDVVYTMGNGLGLGYTYSAGSSTSDYVISLTVDTAASVSTTMTFKMTASYDA